MKISQFTFLFLVLVVFILGMALYCSGKMNLLNPGFQPYSKENMEGPKRSSTVLESTGNCPNMLIKRGNLYLLYNTSQSFQNGINPLVFESLEQYTQYYNNRQQQGKPCPQLFVQQEFDAQGNQVMRVRPGPFDVGGGLSGYPAQKPSPIPVEDASRDNPPYNQNLYPGFDPISLYAGRYTTLDQVHDSTKNRPGGSLNPMDPNWAGVIETQKAIDAGVFEENNIYMGAR
jgi:hypothetical protein